MYKYSDTQPVSGYDETVPAEAILINEIPLERQVSGFTTLNVSGREAIAKKISSQEIDGSQGSIFISSKYPSRDITVKYMLRASSNEEFRRKFELLNFYLKENQFIFGFNDDREYFYTGTVSSVGSFPEGTNTGVSTFTINCSDPFKYKRKQSIYGNSSTSITINEPILYPTLPDEIDVTLSSSASSIIVSTGDLKLVFNGSFVSGDVLKILPKAEDQVLLNDKSNMALMTYTSPLEIFKLKENSTVTTNVGTIAVKIRDKRL